MIGMIAYALSSHLPNGKRRRRATFYWHGYCPIRHRRQDTANRCARSAAYREVERKAIAREREEEAQRERYKAYRAANPWHKEPTLWLAVTVPLLVAVLLCLVWH